MLLAMCADTGMLLGLLFFMLLVGAAVAAPFVYGFVLFLRWADARRKRLAGEPEPAPHAASILGL